MTSDVRSFPAARRTGRKGQALVEFCLCASLVLMLTFASFEVARYVSLSLRIASSVREAGRLFVAGEIEPETGGTRTELDAEIKSEVYDQIDDMISPANMDADGKLFVSILIRVDPNNDTDYTVPNTYDDDYIKIEYQFSYPSSAASGTRAAWTSRFGTEGATVASTVVPLDVLKIGERTVVMEIFHKTNLVANQGILKTSYLDYIYDKAIF